MADHSKIEWCDASWNPIRARNRKTGAVGWFCVHASPGCGDHSGGGCYSEALNRRLGTGVEFKAQNRDKVEIYLDDKVLCEPLRWKRPRRIFVCSMTDWMADFVPAEWIDRIFAVMRLCPQHLFLTLTKRALRQRNYMNSSAQDFPDATRNDDIACAAWLIRDELSEGKERLVFTDEQCMVQPEDWPLKNWWCGASVEDQARADERIPLLLDTPAAVRWVSIEPMLGPVDLFNVGEDTGFRFNALCKKEGIGFRGIGLDWVVVGGESGPAARPFKIEWARSIICQCQVAGVPVFMKQLGAVPIIKDVPPFNGSLNGRFESGFPDGTFFGNRTGRRELNGLQVLLRDRKGGDMAEWPPDLRVREYPAQKRARSAA